MVGCSDDHHSGKAKHGDSAQEATIFAKRHIHPRFSRSVTMFKTHTSRIAAAFIGSFALNVVLLVLSASYDPNRDPRSLTGRIVDILGIVGGLLASPFSTHESMALAMILLSIFFYWIVLWAIVEVVMAVTARIKTGSRDATSAR